jgi:hypothetical protein
MMDDWGGEALPVAKVELNQRVPRNVDGAVVNDEDVPDSRGGAR